MRYDGQKLEWPPFGNFNASSGKAIEIGLGDTYQKPEYEHLQDHGPIPEGEYLVPLKLGTAQLNKHGQVEPAADFVIEELPTGVPIPESTPHPITGKPRVVAEFPAWGSRRVKLKVKKIKNPKASKRFGFYIHDSTKGETAGCIEVDGAFFTHLLDEAKKATPGTFILLTVDYTKLRQSGGKTNGLTKGRPAAPVP